MTQTDFEKTIRRADCCGWCEFNRHYDGVFRYCDIKKTTDNKRPIHIVTDTQICDKFSPRKKKSGEP